MPTRFSIRITAVAIAGGLVLALVSAWRADRRDRAQLAADLAAAKQLLAQADARQHDRDAQLAQTLAGLAAEKRSVTTPAQIVRPAETNPVARAHHAANPQSHDQAAKGHV